MSRIVRFFENEKVKNTFWIVKVVAMLFLLWIYLMYADLSTAPEFIYNQF